uniref:RNA polymerase-associated protein LEO1 n=1 Tax=Eutreptiella gymnastica TaxID=73025 RepID=A0A7S1HXY6_9EUGL|mmetsp:Transcript_113657/g.197489  ORF Transcript_113657/g.197489 Transcript_113657/m.197489 type:complete len:428 (+) Transcript_113657:55-1338(+)
MQDTILDVQREEGAPEAERAEAGATGADTTDTVAEDEGQADMSKDAAKEDEDANSGNVADDYDGLAVFERGVADMAAEAATNEELNQAKVAARLQETDQDGEDDAKEGENSQWQEIFPDEDEDEDAVLAGEMTYGSLFGEEADEEDADLDMLAVDPALQLEDMPALSMENLFGEEEGEALPRTDLADLDIAHTATELEIPKMPRLSAEDRQQLYYVKIPQALSFEESPYDPAMLHRELERSRDRVITPDNVVRWRHAADGEETAVQSNARIVQWDNGDMHLFVGKEVYDISKHPMFNDNYCMFARGPDGTHMYQQKYNMSMRIRTNLTKKSNAAELISRKIKNTFIKRVQSRELRMGLTDRPGTLPEKQQQEIDRMQRKRDRLMMEARGPTAIPDGDDDAEDVERMRRLTQIKRTHVQADQSEDVVL